MGGSRTCLGRCSFPRSSTKRPPETVQLVLNEAADDQSQLDDYRASHRKCPPLPGPENAAAPARSRRGILRNSMRPRSRASCSLRSSGFFAPGFNCAMAFLPACFLLDMRFCASLGSFSANRTRRSPDRLRAGSFSRCSWCLSAWAFFFSAWRSPCVSRSVASAK